MTPERKAELEEVLSGVIGGKVLLNEWMQPDVIYVIPAALAETMYERLRDWT